MTDTKKYKNIFPKSQDKDLIINEESLKFITPKKTSLLLSQIIRKQTKQKHPRVLDLTANNGGDSIAFGLQGMYVHANEVDAHIFKNLKHNFSEYFRTREISEKNIAFSNSNAISLLQNIDLNNFDIIYIDPPFGKKYQENIRYIPEIQDSEGVDYDMIDLIKNYLFEFPLILLKLPKHKFDINYFIDKLICRKRNIHYEVLASPHKISYCLIKNVF